MYHQCLHALRVSCCLLCGLLLGLLLAATVYGQPEPSRMARPEQPAPIRFGHLMPEDGLSQISVHTILQDRHGFMWFGTTNGLNRYDGYDFKVYRHDPTDTTSLNAYTILSLLEDRQGHIWVGTFGGGLDRLDPATGTFTHFPADSAGLRSPTVLSLHEDRDGTIWIGGWGLNRYDPATETFTQIFPDPRYSDRGVEDQPYNRANLISTIVEDRDGALWVGTWWGLFRYDPSLAGEQAFTRFMHDPEDASSLSDNRVGALYEDRQGTLWVGTRGLNRFNRATGTFDRFYVDLDAQVIRIEEIVEDHTGTLWAGTRSSGLYRLVLSEGEGSHRATGSPGSSPPDQVRDKPGQAFTSYRHNPSDPTSLASNSLRALYKDRQGILWIGNMGSLPFGSCC